MIGKLRNALYDLTPGQLSTAEWHINGTTMKRRAKEGLMASPFLDQNAEPPEQITSICGIRVIVDESLEKGTVLLVGVGEIIKLKVDSQ